MPDVSWLTKSHSKSSLRIIISEVLRRLTALSAAAWQLLVSDSSKQAGPTPGAAGHSVASQERERHIWDWDMGEATQHWPRLVKKVGTSLFCHCENAWHLLLSFTPVLL